MTKYRVGYLYEQEVRKLLENTGYYVVRSAGSKGFFDLVAFNSNSIRLIQVKKRGKLSPKQKTEFQVIFDKLPPNATIEVWGKQNGKWVMDKLFPLDE